ncbi:MULTISPECIES: helix-turn-helix domain-containing protein [Pseudomonas]|uniref:Helix-turn-helix transcriptional regulator n=1 Tax=Pseudomonas coleopterorum TaxID=1605838 RepID=A0AAJ6MUF1_9PSED|nr:helix-turn-helix transcriptional regulator [Pseudomonas coleopterorum]MBD8825826.1 helix-turn-helix transcriptional regulator [Pseudomonas sp. CFBP 13602]WNC11142.1 helix-turn-helix transcriptional regulator [Pseudomonas coleopterorum]
MAVDDHRDLAESIGKAIANQRTQTGLTQDEVAEKLGIGSEAVSRIERGLVVPNVARLFDFADVFGCEAAELLMKTSSRSSDQTRYISQMLQELAPSDRQLILALVESLAERLKRPG